MSQFKMINKLNFHFICIGKVSIILCVFFSVANVILFFIMFFSVSSAKCHGCVLLFALFLPIV